MCVTGHLRKPRVLSPLRSLRVRNEVDLVPLACEDGHKNARGTSGFMHLSIFSQGGGVRWGYHENETAKIPTQWE